LACFLLLSSVYAPRAFPVYLVAFAMAPLHVRSRPREDEEQLTLKCIMMPLILQTRKIGRRPGRQALKVKPEKLFSGSGAKAKRLILRGAGRWR